MNNQFGGQRHDSHQSARSARAGRRRDQLAPCRLVDARCVSGNLGLRRSGSQHRKDLPLYRLPNALRIRLSCQHLRAGRSFRAPQRHPKELCKDSRKRQQTSTCLLRRLWLAHLLLRRGQSAELLPAHRDDYTALCLVTAAADLAAFRARLGGWARRCAGVRERVGSAWYGAACRANRHRRE
jgi:hypothetical protein